MKDLEGERLGHPQSKGKDRDTHNLKEAKAPQRECLDTHGGKAVRRMRCCRVHKRSIMHLLSGRCDGRVMALHFREFQISA